MSKLMENISIATQAVRTLLVVVVVAGVGGAAWYGYGLWDSRDRQARRAAEALVAAREELQQAHTDLESKRREIESLHRRVDEQQVELDRLSAALRLLKIDHRVARLSVSRQSREPGSERLISHVDFQELDDKGNPVGAAKHFQISGDVIYLDSWIVKFEDKYVEQADLHRSTSLVLFRRMFGEDQKPSEGFALDEIGSRPHIYGHGGNMSDWERQIWDDFWSVANDQRKQQELGIRAAHGEAISIKVREGSTYRISLRASAGLALQPEPARPQKPRPSA